MVIPFAEGVVVKMNSYDKVRGILMPEKMEKDMELEVIAIGSAVTKVKIGDRVVIHPMNVLFLKNWLDVDPKTGICKEQDIAAIIQKG